MAAREADEGLVILADEQTAGRGRHGRRWDAPAGSSILMSILFRPDLPASDVNLLTMIVSLAALDGIAEVTGLEAALKWPNDVVVGDRKVGGLLTESSFIGSRLEYAVVGLGLNVNFDPADVANIPSTASSLMVLLGRPVDRLALVRAILTATDWRYRALKAGHSPHAEWSRHLTTIGQRVRVILPVDMVEGVAEGVNRQGSLLVRQDDGTLAEVAAGDVVTLRRHAD
ncbi:MAG: biotin--[acetyl-CoA-carboxylase] ligase [Chloroflexi bacterium]|nr:MAG: biotin--[acetyl-CoA-carboxylase] ligase [Chloroflexota bacterium]